MKTMLILGRDCVSQKALEKIEGCSSPQIVIDNSMSLVRLWRLIHRRRLSIPLLCKMFFCELRRKPKFEEKNNFMEIKNNGDILNLIDEYRPARIILFRAGLVINQEVISKGIPLLNIHCANIPDFGGLGVIQKALDKEVYNQNATLHQVTTTIDEGKVFEVEPYTLDPQKSYCYNENIAYDAGINLLLRALRSSIGIEAECHD